MKEVKRRAGPTLLICLVCSLLLGGIALAMASDNYGIDWSVISGGGGPIGSDNYAARSTLGQTAIGFSSSEDYGVGSGYWPGTLPPSVSYLDLVEGANIICYPGATAALAEALTNIGPGGLDVAVIIWARTAWTNGQWWFYNVAQDYAWPPEFTHLENGRAYLIVVSEDCSWELPHNYGAEIATGNNCPADKPKTPAALSVGVTDYLDLVEGANIICYPGATATLAEALTNIGPDGLDVAVIIWARTAWTNGQWWFYNVAQDYAWPSEFTHLENGRAYLIVVSEDCIWELP